MNKPTIDTNFVYKSLGLKMPENMANKTHSSIRLCADAEKDCIAFVHPRKKDDEIEKLKEILKQRHNALPKNDPSKLTSKQIDFEVHKLHITKLAEEAIKKGASLLVAEIPINDCATIVTDNVLMKLMQLVGCYVSLFNVKGICVTGSTGKTSTCQFVEAMLKANGKKIITNRDNQNDFRGFVNALNTLTHDHEFFLQETQEAPIPWNTTEVSKALKPVVSIITSIGIAHMDVMGSMDNIIQSCLDIQAGMQSDSLLVINGDDMQLKEKIKKVKTQTASYSMENENANCTASNIKYTHKGMSFDLICGDAKLPLQIATLGEHNVYNAMSAFIAGRHLGLTDQEIAKGIAAYKPEGIRQNLTEVKGRTLYLDTFSSTPESMIASINAISNATAKSEKSNRVAVMGNLFTLGAKNAEAHRDVGRAIANSKIDILIHLGVYTHFIAEEARAKSTIEIFEAHTFEQLIELIQTKTKKDDFILVKAGARQDFEQATDYAFGTDFSIAKSDAFKEVAPTTINDYKIRFFDMHTTLTEYTGQATNLTIPKTWRPSAGVSPFNLFAIGKDAFNGNNTVESIIIPSTVRKIYENAFANCPKLTSVYIPPSVIAIEPNAITNTTIKGEPNSYAEEYASKNNLNFIASPEPKAKEIPLKSVSEQAFIQSGFDMGFMAYVNDQPLPAHIKPELVKAELMVPVNKVNTLQCQKLTLFSLVQLLTHAQKFCIFDIYADNLCQQNDPEHALGLAVDLMIKGIPQNKLAKSPEGKWLKHHAPKFGFIQSDTKKPWHFRYVNKTHAHYMSQNNLSLKDYINQLKAEKHLTFTVQENTCQVLHQTPINGTIQVPEGFSYLISTDNQGGYIIDINQDI